MSEATQRDIFFATSFSGHMNYETGIVEGEFKSRVENILAALRIVGGFSVYCAVEAEGWQISDRPAGESMAINYANIEASPIFVGLVDKVGSDGRGLEVQHAIDTGKKVFLATGPQEELSWVMNEIVALGKAEHVPYEQPDELARQIATSRANYL